jgi:hypothetical protein
MIVSSVITKTALSACLLPAPHLLLIPSLPHNFWPLRSLPPFDLSSFLSAAESLLPVKMEKQQPNVDPESGRQGIPHFKLLWDKGIVTDEVVNWDYEGSGTEEDPYVVEWIENDPRNPMTWSTTKKWTCTLCMAFATLAVSFCSSAFAGGVYSISLYCGRKSLC